MKNPSPSRPPCRPRFALAALAALACPAAASCGGDDEPDPLVLGVVLTPGQERDAWAREPAPARVVVSASVAPTSAGGAPATITLADGAWPLEKVSTEGLGAGLFVFLSAEVYDAAGQIVMRGETPFFQTDVRFGAETPVLVGRVGEFARPEAKLAGAWPAPRAALFEGRYVLLVGGGGAGEGGGAEYFDVLRMAPLQFDGAAAEKPLPRAPGSLLSSDGRVALFIDDEGVTARNLFSGTETPVTLETGQAARLSGGDAVLSDAEAAESFVVGPTRAASATSAVLRISSNGTPEIFSVGTPRERAGAVWVPGRGLVVVGGAEGASVEVLAPKAKAFQTLAITTPTVFEPSLVVTPAGDVLILGGVDAAGAPVAPQRLALACTAPCAAAPEALAAAAPLRGGRAFDAGKDGHWLVVGADAEGFSSALLVDATKTPAGAAPVATRVRRKGAASIAVGGGYVATLGGTDPAGAPVQDVEIFTPGP